MDDPRQLLPAQAGEPAPTSDRRRSFLHRLFVLLATSTVAFALTTWMLVRVENPSRLLPLGPRPAGVVRAHLDALNRGNLRAAYDLFSPRYRGQVSFEAFRHLVLTHRQLFRTREVRLERENTVGERTVLDTRLVSADGARYLARFTLVRFEGRWWIDDVRWAAAPQRRIFST